MCIRFNTNLLVLTILVVVPKMYISRNLINLKLTKHEEFTFELIISIITLMKLII